jgi:hypothetical protein
MRIAATFQRAFRVKNLDPYAMEILKRVDCSHTCRSAGEFHRTQNLIESFKIGDCSGTTSALSLPAQ